MVLAGISMTKGARIQPNAVARASEMVVGLRWFRCLAGAVAWAGMGAGLFILFLMAWEKRNLEGVFFTMLGIPVCAWMAAALVASICLAAQSRQALRLDAWGVHHCALRAFPWEDVQSVFMHKQVYKGTRYTLVLRLSPTAFKALLPSRIERWLAIYLMRFDLCAQKVSFTCSLLDANPGVIGHAAEGMFDRSRPAGWSMRHLSRFESAIRHHTDRLDEIVEAGKFLSWGWAVFAALGILAGGAAVLAFVAS